MGISRARSKASRRLQFDSLETGQVLSTYVVSPLGNNSNPGTAAKPFLTLQQAANVVQPGDTVDVLAGKYTGFVMGWNSPQGGLPGKQITFSAAPNVYIDAHNSETLDGIDLEGASYVTIKGFIVEGMGRAGIRAVRDTGVVIEDNYTEGNTDWNIYTSFSNYVQVLDNTASGAVVQHGIYIANSTVDPEVIGNFIYDNANCGIQMNGDISQGGTGVITGAVVEDNTIVDNGRTGGSGINCDGVQNSLIVNNIITGNKAAGIALFQEDAAQPAIDNIVANNTIDMASTSKWAIEINSASTGNQLYNNILLNADSAHGSISITSDSLPGFVSNHNIVSQFNLDGNNLSLAGWQAATGQDVQSVVATAAQTFAYPTLVFASEPNVILLTTGPAYDTGINLSQYFTTNQHGTARSAKGAWNIGAL